MQINVSVIIFLIFGTIRICRYCQVLFDWVLIYDKCLSIDNNNCIL